MLCQRSCGYHKWKLVADPEQIVIAACQPAGGGGFFVNIKIYSNSHSCKKTSQISHWDLSCYSGKSNYGLRTNANEVVKITEMQQGS